MTDASVVAIVTGMVSLIGTAFTGLIAYLMARQKIQAEQVARTLKQADDRTERSLDDIAVVAAATHTLVNSASLVQLRLNAMLSKRIAEFPGATTEDKEAAKVANELYLDHKARQEDVDKFPAVQKAMENIKGK